MTQWQRRFHRPLLELVQPALKTPHGWIILSGLFIGLCYFPVWLTNMLTRASQGSAGIPLISAAVYLGIQELWKHRRQLKQMTAAEDDRLLGHILIISGVVLYPLCTFAVWSQSLLWLLILVGIAFSCWGGSFFRRFPLPTLLFAFSVYPKPGIMARIVWEALAPAYGLEKIMAWFGWVGLQAIGQPATLSGKVISLSGESVVVGWGCNGFNMAFTMGVTGLILGLFLQQSWLKISSMVAAGIFLALLFNVPRIMLLALAAVYWSDEAFQFWHGGWGSQIFTSILFTPYYYIVMWLVNRRSS